MIEGNELEMFGRSIGQATSRHTGEALDAALTDLGWLDALGIDARTAISLLFPLLGRANVTSSALDHVVAAGLGVALTPAAAVVLPGLGSWTAPGRLTKGQLALHGLGTAALSRSETAVVPAPGGTTTAVTVETATLTLRPVQGIDPAFGLVEVTGESVPYDPVDGAAADGWDAAVQLAQLAVGHELVGAARAMLELAREHALDRIQFGQPISRFQAVRHRLAESLVAIEAADGVLAAAWEAPSPQLSASAKALAGRGARTTARHCQQVLAGIGFTAEHPFHRYFRRTLLLDQLFGTTRSLTEDLGRELLAAHQLPALLPL